MKKNNGWIFKAISLTVLGVYTLLMLSIFGWALISSLKHKLDFSLYPTSLFPKFKGIQWGNYSLAYLTMKVIIDLPNGGTYYVYAEEMLLNSVIWVFGGVFLQTFTTIFVSYCCSKYSSHTFSKIIYFATVFAITIPLIGALPSQMSIVRTLGVYDTFLVIPVLKINFVSTYFLVFYALFQKIPSSYREAAELDGAGHWCVFLKIQIPMVVNTLIAVCVLNFIAQWNIYSDSMMFLPSHPTLAQGLYDIINGEAGRNENLSDATSLAAAFIAALPSFVLFLVFRKKIMTNVSMGGLKG